MKSYKAVVGNNSLSWGKKRWPSALVGAVYVRKKTDFCAKLNEEGEGICRYFCRCHRTKQEARTDIKL